MIIIIIINDNKNKNTTKKKKIITITIIIISWIHYSLISAKHRIYGDRGGLQLFTESPPARGVFGRSQVHAMPGRQPVELFIYWRISPKWIEHRNETHDKVE